ncbi:hypothetical protein J3459_013087 [Metarhizium acridum]|nr:hypothetical protein J3459_013087 [Metarhizium acridum]
MRASLTFGAVVASSLLYQAAAQATYGNPDDGSDTENSAGQVDSPQSTVTVFVNSGENSNGFPNGKSCQMQGTTTVFVTVYPTVPVSNGNESPAAITGTDGTPDHTGYRTIQVSPLDSSNGNRPTVQAFTTVTISDLWSGVGLIPETIPLLLLSQTQTLAMSPVDLLLLMAHLLPALLHMAPLLQLRAKVPLKPMILETMEVLLKALYRMFHPTRRPTRQVTLVK